MVRAALAATVDPFSIMELQGLPAVYISTVFLMASCIEMKDARGYSSRLHIKSNLGLILSGTVSAHRVSRYMDLPINLSLRRRKTSKFPGEVLSSRDWDLMPASLICDSSLAKLVKMRNDHPPS
ncbi:uncharacterized protein PgNI_07437 [Pyricularia grisea]|uniref:Uncharacterized protein n=1 Tax=Pyricularia grisea TaxID=148305 RepID=A0A6P8B0P3_PYRGI|nr:uncharacterized protein PgNI_07437 [Pyricularia grisea]TLD08422.1 hypothetical protein PgNI_07437 [Pyricularia grisea]